MKKYFIFGAIILFVLLMTNSCIIFVDEGDGTLRIVNESDTYTILFVRIKSTDSDDWGGDRLGDGSIYPNGDSWSFDIEAGTYDVWITDNDLNLDNDDYYAYSVDVDVDSTTTLYYNEFTLSEH